MLSWSESSNRNWREVLRTLDYKLLHALDVIVAQQSFDKAAELLNISQSAISQRIKLLEQNIAQPVLIRSQPLKTTEIGQKLLRHFRQVRQLEFDLVKDILPDEQESVLAVSIAINADTLANWFIPALAPLLKRHPIELDLQVVDETNTQELLKRGEVFAALSTQKESFTGCKVVSIGVVEYFLCASPDFEKQYFSKGITQASLQKAPGVEFDQRDTMHSDFIEQNFGVKSGSYPCHRLRSSEAFVDMALEGVAYCLLPEFQAAPYLATGKLIELAPDKHLPRVLYWHSWILEKGLHKQISIAVIEYGQKLLSKPKLTN